MQTTATTLLHFALRAEAQAFIDKLRLAPAPCSGVTYRLFDNERFIALVSGIGKQATADALHHFFSTHHSNLIRRAYNIGIVGCNNSHITIGTSFIFAPYKPPSSPPVVSVRTPQTRCDTPTTTLYDMECDAFYQTVRRYLPPNRIGVIKVVSDHLDAAIPSKAFVKELMLQHYQTIYEVLDA